MKKYQPLASLDTRLVHWAGHLNTYITLVEERGYTLGSIQNQVQLITRFLAWFRVRHTEIDSLDEHAVHRFSRSPQNAHRVGHSGKAPLLRFVNMLCEQGVIPPQQSQRERPLPQQQRLIKNYELYLLEESKLVGGFLGQTAMKTNEVIEQALGGVLFIDEAYSLADSQQDMYGKEAIETLLKGMEDHRDDLVVIVAGYPREMTKFFSSNPGLKSRFNRFINFEDYSAEELFQIFERFANKAQYKLSANAAIKLQAILKDEYQSRDNQFGNGRFVRTLFERSMQQLASRVVSLPSLTNDVLMTIEAVDLPEPKIVSKVPQTRDSMGFAIPNPAATREKER